MPIDITLYNGSYDSTMPYIPGEDSSNVSEDVSIHDTARKKSATESTSEESTTSEVEDGVDDGNISGEEKLSSLVKGLASPITTALEHPVATAAVVTAGVAAAILLPGVVAVAAPALVAAGTIYGGYKVAKGVYKAATADTDAKAKEAYEGIGSGVADVGLSYLGAKPALAAAKAGGTAAETAEVATTALKAGETASTAGTAAQTAEVAKMTKGEAVVECIKTTKDNIQKGVETIKSREQLTDKVKGGIEYVTEKSGSIKSKFSKSSSGAKDSKQTTFDDFMEPETKVRTDAKDPVTAETSEVKSDTVSTGSTEEKTWYTPKGSIPKNVETTTANTGTTTKKTWYTPSSKNPVLNPHYELEGSVESAANAGTTTKKTWYTPSSKNPVLNPHYELEGSVESAANAGTTTKKTYYTPNSKNPVLNPHYELEGSVESAASKIETAASETKTPTAKEVDTYLREQGTADERANFLESNIKQAQKKDPAVYDNINLKGRNLVDCYKEMGLETKDPRVMETLKLAKSTVSNKEFRNILSNVNKNLAGENLKYSDFVA